MEHVKERPFFVVGVGRSGTTLLRLMLHHHPRLALPYESHFVTHYQDRLSQYGDLNITENLQRLVNEILDEPNLKMWDQVFAPQEILDAVEDASLGGVVDALYRVYASHRGKARWGDKSDYLDRMHIINDVFPTAQFIHIVRDGRDVARSVMKLSWGPDDILRSADWWDEHTRLGRRMGAILGPKRYTEVRYEDLVEHSERELRRLCDFLGEDYSADMLSYHKGPEQVIPDALKEQHKNFDKPPDASRCYSWKREMHPIDVELFTRRASRMLEEFEYEVPPLKASKIRLGLRVVAIFSRRLLSSH